MKLPDEFLIIYKSCIDLHVCQFKAGFSPFKNVSFICFNESSLKVTKNAFYFKSTVQIKKVLINESLRVSKVPWKFCIPTIFNFGVIWSWKLLLSFLFKNKTLRVNNFKNRTAIM